MSLMERTEQALARHFEAACGHGAPPRLVDAMRHAVFSGGARIRPQLCMAVAVACGDDRPELTDAAAVALELGLPLVLVRKKGKLPFDTLEESYELEYGSATVEIHTDAVKEGDRVVLVDDLIATGGTATGAIRLLQQMGADVVAACFVIDLPDLGGAKKIEALGVPVRSLVAFEGH